MVLNAQPKQLALLLVDLTKLQLMENVFAIQDST